MGSYILFMRNVGLLFSFLAMFCLAVRPPFLVLGLETLSVASGGANLRAHLIFYPIPPGISNLHCLMYNVLKAISSDIFF